MTVGVMVVVVVVCGCIQESQGRYLVPSLEAVHFCEQLQQALLPFLAAAVCTGASRLSDCIDLICTPNNFLRK